jgi:3D (Asp-Asp-Asp) domain-containing protein
MLLLLLLTACSPTLGEGSARLCAVGATAHAAPVTEAHAAPVTEAPAKTETAKVTAYTADCKGCIGITRDGTPADSHRRILAADLRYHPLGTKVELTFPDGDVEVYTVRDTGGDIKGRGRFDILVQDKRFAVEWGVRHLKYRVLD